MLENFNVEWGRSAQRLRVDTLIKLRWMAVIGQSMTVLLVYFGLKFQLPIASCFFVISMSAALNLALRFRFPLNHRLDESSASILLSYDVIQLSLLLWLTGGLANPFSILFLAPVMISAVSLSGIRTFMLAILMSISATILAFFHLPIPWQEGETLEFPVFYILGIWISIILGAGFTWVYASRVAREAQLLSDALAATELVLAREQHLTQLDGLAAAAAHELGTPLATITLVIKELSAILPKEGPIAEDMVLLNQEAHRCRAILSKLKSLDNGTGGMLDSLSLSLLIEEVIHPHKDFGVSVNVTKQGEGHEPIILRNPGILYGLGNLVENAIDFAKTRVDICASWSDHFVKILIQDDGLGFSPDILMKLGEPYVTLADNARRAKGEEGGLGLGLFIAKTLLERSGAMVRTENAKAPAKGAIVEIEWTRARFEQIK
jgi:two-component system sensor histidine kinase RegB